METETHAKKLNYWKGYYHENKEKMNKQRYLCSVRHRYGVTIPPHLAGMFKENKKVLLKIKEFPIELVKLFLPTTGSTNDNDDDK